MQSSSVISLAGSLITGVFNANHLRAESDLFLKDTVFERGASLIGAKIVGDVDMTGAHFSDTLNANYNLQVGGDLLMYKASFKNVYLSAAKITGRISMSGASFDGTLDANTLQGSRLEMVKASFKDVNLGAAKIAGPISMGGASFGDTLYADVLQVGGDLDMQSATNKACFKVVLNGANITGQTYMGNAGFDGKIDAIDLQVGGYLDLRGATLAGLDLSGASITRDLVVGEPGRAPRGGGLSLAPRHHAASVRLGNRLTPGRAVPFPPVAPLQRDARAG